MRRTPFWPAFRELAPKVLWMICWFVGNHETTREQADSVDGIGHGHRTQPPKDGIDGPDDPYQPHGQPQHGGLGLQARDGLHIQHFTQAAGARIENDRQQDSRVGKQEDERCDRLRASVIVLFQHLGNSRDPALQEARQEEQGHRDQRNDRNDFPDHHRQAVLESRAVKSDHLLGRQVR